MTISLSISHRRHSHHNSIRWTTTHIGPIRASNGNSQVCLAAVVGLPPHVSLPLDFEDQHSSLTNVEHLSPTFAGNTVGAEDEDDEDDDEEEGDDEEEDEDEEEESSDDDESDHVHARSRVTSACTISQRRHSDTIHSSSLSYGTPIVKRRCTYSSMHDDEQKRSVLVESYRKLRGVKKPKLQVSLLICNLIKRLEKTFTKTVSAREEAQQYVEQQSYVQYYQQRTSYRSSSSDSLYMSHSSITDDSENSSPVSQQYSPPHSATYDSDKVLLTGADLRPSASSSYHSSSTDAYWLAQSNFAVPAVPVVSSIGDDETDVSLHGDGDYLDLSDNTLSSTSSSVSPPPSSASSSSSSSSSSTSSDSISTDCRSSSTTATTSSSITKPLVDTNNNHHQQHNDYFVYQQLHSHHHHHPNDDDDGPTFLLSS